MNGYPKLDFSVTIKQKMYFYRHCFNFFGHTCLIFQRGAQKGETENRWLETYFFKILFWVYLHTYSVTIKHDMKTSGKTLMVGRGHISHFNFLYETFLNFSSEEISFSHAQRMLSYYYYLLTICFCNNLSIIRYIFTLYTISSYSKSEGFCENIFSTAPTTFIHFYRPWGWKSQVDSRM